MPYTVPQHIDPSKIFLVNFSELEGRWDPFFTLYNKRVKNVFEYPLVQLKDVLIKSPQYGTAECGIERKTETEPRYIRITDIDELGNVIDGLGATAENLEEQYILNDGDILFARSGATVGKTYLHKTLPYQCFFAGYMIRIVVDKAKILPEYLFVYTQLQPYKDWVKAIQRAAAQPNINAEEYKSLPVPLPPLPIQQQIVDKYNTAIRLRRIKLALSKAKLVSIDQYLLDELGIILPEETHQKTFIVNYKDVDGGRLDPKSYCNNVKNLKIAIIDSRLEKQQLNTFIVNESSGDWGEDMERQDLDFTTYTKCLVLRATEFDNRYNLKLDNSRVKYRYISNAKLKRMNVQPNDLIIEKSGGSEDQPVGRIGILTQEILDNNIIAFSNFLHKITVTGIDPRYLFFYLKTMHNIGLTDSMQSQTNGIRNLIMSEYKKQNIIVPDKQTQTRIVDHISVIRAEAKALEEEANAILEQAKKKVEEMILG